ncbi:MAG: PIG-L deacetylase family protein [Acidimicrobiales bacterium]
MPSAARRSPEAVADLAGCLRAGLPIAAPGTSSELPRAAELLVVCAHPDDESFGLGAILAAYCDRGTRVRVLCFSCGEASTLGGTAPGLGEVRAAELSAAAGALGVEGVTLLSYPDSHLEEVPVDELADTVGEAVGNAEMLLTFDEGGITGHPDHCRATAAGVVAGSRYRLPVLAWTLPERVAAQLNAEYTTNFVGRSDAEVDIVVDVDRKRQLAAIACHASQSNDNPVLWRRLDLLGRHEYLRWLGRT